MTATVWSPKPLLATVVAVHVSLTRMRTSASCRWDVPTEWRQLCADRGDVNAVLRKRVPHTWQVRGAWLVILTSVLGSLLGICRRRFVFHVFADHRTSGGFWWWCPAAGCHSDVDYRTDHGFLLHRLLLARTVATSSLKDNNHCYWQEDETDENIILSEIVTCLLFASELWFCDVTHK